MQFACFLLESKVWKCDFFLKYKERCWQCQKRSSFEFQNFEIKLHRILVNPIAHTLLPLCCEEATLQTMKKEGLCWNFVRHKKICNLFTTLCVLYNNVLRAQKKSKLKSKP